MTMDICVESYGMIVHVLDTGLITNLSSLAARADRFYRPGAVVPEELCTVKLQAERLAFPEAKALWLVDVCGCSYDEAASEMWATRDELAALVSGGRTQIRAGLDD